MRMTAQPPPCLIHGQEAGVSEAESLLGPHPCATPPATSCLSFPTSSPTHDIPGISALTSFRAPITSF